MSIQDNLDKINLQIKQACARVNRSPQEITLLAVSKYASDQAVDTLHSLGITTFGENRIQQARQRVAAFPEIEWHFIGSLQTNKLKYCQNFSLIHSLDRYKLAREAQNVAEKWDKVINMLIQVNVAGEDSKHGIAAEEVRDFAIAVRDEFPLIRVRGLMTMAPLGPPEQTRPVFRALRKLRDKLGEELSLELPVLSMGMSNDFLIAIEEGATIVRIGSALFADNDKEG